MKVNNKNGFTLLELIVVIIIVGVMASLAVPRFFTKVEYSRSSEAFHSLSVIRKAIERCGFVYNDVTACGDGGFGEIDVADPGVAPGAHFGYTITIASGAEAIKDYTIKATRNAFEGGDPTDFITLQITIGGITRAGTGAFSAIN